MKLNGLGFAGFLLVGCAASPKPAATAASDAAAASTSASTETGQQTVVLREAVAVAMQLYAARDYAAAAAAFERAYAEEPDADLMLARAQSLRLSGQCDQARVLYDEFLATTTDPTYHNAVQHLAEDCPEPASPTATDQLATR